MAYPNWFKILVILFLSIFIVIDSRIILNRAVIVHNGLEATAHITRISSATNKAILYQKTFVQYTVDNIEYQNYVYMKGKKNIGEPVAILYHPDNPDKITLKYKQQANDSVSRTLFVSGPAFIVCLILLFPMLKQAISATLK